VHLTRKSVEFASLHTNVSQISAATTRFKSTRHVTRFTERECVGLQQSTDVCLTTLFWLHSMTTSVTIFLHLPCSQAMRGLDWWSRGGPGLIWVRYSLIV